MRWVLLAVILAPFLALIVYLLTRIPLKARGRKRLDEGVSIEPDGGVPRRGYGSLRGPDAPRPEEREWPGRWSPGEGERRG